MYSRGFSLIVSGPTGVGKTAFVDELVQVLPAEIVNGDMGQLYTPLTIGTAKPDWQHSKVPHHLFDLLTKPEYFSAMSFRESIQNVCNQIWQKNKIPIIVGGSGYYLTALFFPPAQYHDTIKKGVYEQRDLWKELYTIDPIRARDIDPNDHYRLSRALDIWYSTGIKPSLYAPMYDSIFERFIFIWLTRDRDDLYRRIAIRTKEMIENGWIEEVRMLLETPWQQFLMEKKIIGYPEIIAYCQGALLYDAMLNAIIKKTQNYAKRQLTFMRMLSKKLESRGPSLIFNLTHQSADQCRESLMHNIKELIGS